MRTVADIEAAITLLRLHNADALRLGELVSLAARIEPELLRAVRLELTPFDAAAEADLWFSLLVETRTADWIVLQPAAARELRSALVIDRSSLTAAHELITKSHVNAPATIILEEEISWLALIDGPNAAEAIESRLRLVLGKLLEDPRKHKGLAHWFAGAAQRLPEKAQATEAYALLYFVTSGLLDGRHINAPQPALSSIDSLAGALPASIPKLNVWATLNDYGFTIRPEKVPGFVPLEVPRTDPLLFELRPLYESARFITLRRGETKTFQIRSREIELRTAAGDAYRLRRPQKRSAGDLQHLVMGFGGTGAHILTAIKELTVLKHGRMPDNIKSLLLDTIADWEPGKVLSVVGASEEKMAKSDDEAATLSPLTEYFQLVDFPPDLRTHVFDYLSPAGDPDGYPHLKDWLHAPWLSEHVPVHPLAITIGAAQQRQIGRYAMFKNADRVIAHLRPIIRRLSDLAKGSDVNVWLIGSSAGGTGAGCLIDAAYLTRLAGDNFKLKVTGVIVLPNVYSNVSGISKGRAYSLLRELERVQEQGVPLDDRYVDRNGQTLVSSRVVYDRDGQQVAIVNSHLFDDLFYLGSDCPHEESRKKFFTSVASAIDPYLDTASGPSLLEKAVNDHAAASSFGAARIYVPTETFAEMFAWEQVAEYLRRIAAPKEVGDRVERLYAGSDQDRADSANQKFRGLIELFKQLLDLESKPERSKESFARNELDARKIVTLWYALTGGNRTPDEQRVLLTYAEPCYSLTEPERPESTRDWEVKTYRENAADPSGVKEKQEDSRTRFADKLEEVKRRYTNPAGGERTFEKGRRHVLETISSRLEKRVDELFIGELAQRRAEFAQSKSAFEQGTVLTQLFAEVTWMLGDRGPLRKVHHLIGKFIATVASDESALDYHYTSALHALRDSRKSGMFDFGAWVESYQQAARDVCTAFLSWYQKQALLKDMQQLVLNVEKRLREWERLLMQFFDAMVRREGRGEGEASALFTVTQIHLKGTLEERLYRAARNRSLISFGEQPDPQMHGYQEELRIQSAKGLAASLLSNSHWEASLTADGMPNLMLRIDFPDLGQRQYTLRDIRSLPHVLYQHFYRPINARLSNTDVFDYLIWLREHRGIELETVMRVLNEEATTLINAGAVPETRTLIYRHPIGGSKKDLADAMALKLGSPESVERGYSDRNAIVLVKMKKPSLNQIADIEDCQKDYIMLRADRENNNEAHDQKLRRALVFHPFRQEMEAWYIERYYLKNAKLGDVPMLPPRIARLLEDPEMMQLFAHGLATSAIEKIGDNWVWHAPDGDLMLTDYESQANADLIKAAINFVLRQGEATWHSARRISREDVKQSILQSTQQRGRTLNEMLSEFRRELDYFLKSNAPADLHEPLKMVFTFYCDPNTRTSLEFRMDL